MQGERDERDEHSFNERTERFDCEKRVRDNYAGTKLAVRKGSKFFEADQDINSFGKVWDTRGRRKISRPQASLTKSDRNLLRIVLLLEF